MSEMKELDKDFEESDEANLNKAIQKQGSVKTVLITPPHFYLFNSQGIPQLTAYLKSRGRDVEQVLVDTDMYSFLLSTPELERCFQLIKTTLLPTARQNAALRERLEARVSEPGGLRDVMTRDVLSAGPDESSVDCMKKMQQRGCRHLPVIEDGKVLGMLSLRDLMRVEIKEKDEEIRWMNAYIRDVPPDRQG